ncbi:MAG TPA: NAD-dependent deacylase [Polyangiaceae bacterium]
MNVAKYTHFEPIEIGPKTRVFVLTGAGISQESGIATFRDANGLWEKHRFEDVASPEGWAKDDALVWRFYSERRNQTATCEANAAHRALGDLEAKIGAHLFLCTQNVDDLHEKGGSKHVVHMHGELFSSRCEDDRCALGKPHVDRNAYLTRGEIPKCRCGKRLRPHICWFGEMPFEMERIAAALDQSDVFVTIGSSGAVYPAAGFVRHARALGHVRTIYVGPEEPDNAREFDECRLGKATEVVPTLFRVV